MERFKKNAVETLQSLVEDMTDAVDDLSEAMKDNSFMDRKSVLGILSRVSVLNAGIEMQKGVIDHIVTHHKS